MPDIQLTWPQDSPGLYDRMSAAGILNPDTGEAFTVVECDNALQSAVEALASLEGHRCMLLTNQCWRNIVHHLVPAFGLDHTPDVEEALWNL